MTWTQVDARSDPDFVVAPDERLDWARTIGIGAQHVVAMFGATFLVPVLTGFPPATTLLFSGVGRYLGSSFSESSPWCCWSPPSPSSAASSADSRSSSPSSRDMCWR